MYASILRVCVFFFTNDLPTTKPYEKEKKATACFALSLLDDSSLPFAEVMEKNRGPVWRKE